MAGIHESAAGGRTVRPLVGHLHETLDVIIREDGKSEIFLRWEGDRNIEAALTVSMRPHEDPMKKAFGRSGPEVVLSLTKDEWKVVVESIVRYCRLCMPNVPVSRVEPDAERGKA
jgi:hypothetical protein